MSAEVICDYCGQPAELVTGAVTYPHRKDLAERRFWYCAGCQAWTSCYRAASESRGDGTVPMGRLADAELRRWRTSFHAVFDPIWKTGTMTRDEAYAHVAAAMHLEVEHLHSSLFTLEQIRDAVRIAAAVDLTGRAKR